MSSSLHPAPARRLRGTVLAIARNYGVRNVRVFGSYARGDQRRRSDLDLLVEMPEGSSLLDLVGFKLDLEQALSRRVDVLTDRGISRYLRKRILHEARPL
jgi:predicted nucleotidyltransferase